MTKVRIAACQINPTVGDLENNSNKIITALKDCEAMGTDLAVFPELALTGYPPEDLTIKPGFAKKSLEYAQRIAASASKTVGIFGFIEPGSDPDTSQELVVREDSDFGEHIFHKAYNSAAIVADSDIFGICRKQVLPNYSVFDEKRVFLKPSADKKIYLIAGVGIGVVICEDAWIKNGPIATFVDDSTDLIVVINASPFCTGKLDERIDIIKERVTEINKPIFYVNMVGAQDELVFDGGSFLIGTDLNIVFSAPQFKEGNFIFDLEIPDKQIRQDKKSSPVTSISLRPLIKNGEPVHFTIKGLTEIEQIYSALVTGTRDYVNKNTFKGALIGLSGGIDSSLVAAIAVDALGADNVIGIAMPSRYNAHESLTDAQELASLLNIDFKTIPIESVHKEFESLFNQTLEMRLEGLAGENIQSRIRGVILMAISNLNSYLVLTTSNKSELAVGYSTLYGDSAGGFSVIKDVLKTQVYELCKWRNLQGYVIPENVLVKPPSAELRFDQRDDQSLPPYDLLDACLIELINHDHIVSEIDSDKYPLEVLQRIANLIDAAEYKRRQSPPGIKISSKSFGKDRRMPITNRFRD